MVSQAFPNYIEEFRIMKLETLIKDLHKLNPEELKKVQREINDLLGFQHISGDSK